MNKEKYKNKKWLNQKYIVEKLSSTNIAEICKCDHKTILFWLAKYDIKIRSKGSGGRLFARGKNNPNWGKDFSGEKNPRWKGGKTRDHNGYVLVLKPEHPHANKYTGYILEHRLIMEEKLGRYLESSEIVHHIDGNRKNNNAENLLLENKKTHETGYVGGFKAGYILGFINALKRKEGKF